MKLILTLLLLSSNVYSMELFKPLFSNSCTTQEITKILPENLTDRINTIHLAINNIANELKVNPCLILSIVWTESTFKPFQRSDKGAEGLMQLMGKTKSAMRSSMGYKLNKMVTSNLPSTLSYRELENLIIGTYYVKKLIKKFKGNTKYAIIAYNQGPTRTMSQLNKGIK
jgi:soluble lytic murein transglycosylase-like protein